ncbi:MAG TPA: response regulator transcription factor [Bacteroidota bacterium]|nr:response regulator transcription factor [Bacteroidota bacterium]
MQKLRVLLADDHTLVRAGMRSLLKDVAWVEVVAEAGTGREAVELVEKLRPQAVLMDIAMSGLNGLEAAERIIKSHPDCRVIILSMHSSKEYVMKALHIGVMGYLIKDAATSELEVALTAIARGQKYLSPAISTYLVEEYTALSPDHEQNIESLTPRQREILQLIAEGRTTKEIASILNVSPKTAETHRTQLMERLNIHDIAGLVRYALRAGVVSPEG